MIAAFGLVIGILAGLLLEPSVPESLQPYLPIAVVAALDAVFGALRAFLDGIFDDKVFVISFLSNVTIAALIVYLGDQLAGCGRHRHDRLMLRRDPTAAPELRAMCDECRVDAPSRN